MKLIKLIILTAIMISLSGLPALGQGYQPYTTDGIQVSESAFYTSNMPSTSETLVPLGQAQSQVQSQVQIYPGFDQSFGQATPVNALWIVDPSGTYRRTSLSIPLSYWAREDVIPGISGYMTIYERYPSGIINNHYLGYVNAGNRYMVWFRADLRGTHDIWYTVDGMESNHVSFDVYRSSQLTLAPVYTTPYYTAPYYTPYYGYYYPRPSPRPSPYSYVGTSTGARASS